MSDTQDKRYLTRREKRIQNTQEIPIVKIDSDGKAISNSEVKTVKESFSPSKLAENNIPLVDENGRPLSRRELRELWAKKKEQEEAQSVVDESSTVVSAASVENAETESASGNIDEPPHPEQAEADRKAAETAASERAVAAIAEQIQKQQEDSENIDDENISNDENAVEENEQEKQQEEQVRDSEDFTFPEIPVEDSENVEVFQDHATVNIEISDIINPAEPESIEAKAELEFEEIINRAVVDEGLIDDSTAIILPDIPNTLEIGSAIDSTGEIIITGSIEMPKSLSETGAHARLSDNVDAVDAMGDVENIATSEDHSKPVSAVRAVSALQPSSEVIVTEVAKHDKRLPVILTLTGVALIIGVGVIVFVAIQNGVF